MLGDAPPRGPQSSPPFTGTSHSLASMIQFIKSPSTVGTEKACVLVTQPCPTLCDAVDCSPPGSSVHGILQARTLERAANSSSTREAGTSK